MSPHPAPLARGLSILAMLFASTVVQFPAVAATDLANAPLASSSTDEVKPNILFTLDDSGSMNWEYMPDNLSGSTNAIGFRNNQCNLVYYNPNTVYVVPKNSTGGSINSGSPTAFTAAYNDGYYSFTGGSNTARDLSSSFRAYVSVGGNTDTSQPAYYWKYLGSQNLRPQWGDCNKTLSSSTDSTTTGYCFKSSNSTYTRISTTDPTDADCNAALTGSTLLWKKIIVSSTSGPATADINGDGSTNASDADERQNFANWYSYYSTRMNMMKSASGRAFVQLGDTYRIGFITINPVVSGSSVSSTKYLAVAPFDATQKSDWLTKLYSQNSNGSTPLRQALARAGRHFAGKTNGINAGMSGDPVQYSCQQNFNILTTDGYWNGDAGVKLDGTTAMDNQDGVLAELDAYRPAGSKFYMSPRPIFDGASQTYTWNTLSYTYQTASCPLGTQAQQRITQYQSCSSPTTVLRQRTSSNSGGSWSGYQTIAGTVCESDVVGANQRFCYNGNVTARRNLTGVSGESATYGPWVETTSCSEDNSGSGRRECRRVAPYSGCGGTWSDAQCTNTDTSTLPYCRSTTGEWTNVASCTPSPQDASGAQIECQDVPLNGYKLQYSPTITSTTYGGPGGPTVPTNQVVGTPVTTPGIWTDVTPATCTATAPAIPVPVEQTGDVAPPPPDGCTGGSQVWPCEVYASGGTLTATVNGATWTAAGADPTVSPATATLTTSLAHAFLVGHSVTISGVSPSGYRGTYEILAVPDNTHFTYALSTNPGAYSGSGTAALFSGSSNSLADVAQHYYKTDLRTSTLGNCTGALGADVCSNNVPSTGSGAEDDRANWQHMTTFTMGLGLNGTLVFSPSYKTDTCLTTSIASATWSGGTVTVTTTAAHSYFVGEAVTVAGATVPAGYRGQFKITDIPSTTKFSYSVTSDPGAYAGTGTATACPDFARIRDGKLNWPTPTENNPSALDDLWHAAVNGRGQYFSAGNPESVITGLTNALAGISARVASAAAAATSNLEPVAGDNFAYTAQYTTLRWTGELEAREIDLASGAVGGTPIWSAQTKLDALTKSACDNRTIKLFRAGATNNLVDFTLGTYACDASGVPTGVASTALDATEQANFNAAKVALLSHYVNLGDGTGGTVNQRTPAAGANLVNFLRGQRGKEGFTSTPAPATNTDINKLYRAREHVLGDIVNAQPVFVKSPFGEYTDSGYVAFRSAKSGRAPMVYVAANDGMLHAFQAGTSVSDANGGVESWAFIPTMVLPNLYKMADENYATNHVYSVDGTPTAADIFDKTTSADCALATPTGPQNCWKTILVGGLNKGGQGYYALDITDPATPKALWEFKYSSTCYDDTDASTKAATDGADCHIGYTYSNPIIGKLADGTWAVFVTSGHNNDDGIGYLYVLNAATGKIIHRISTGVGSAANPSGLNHINGWVENALQNNTITRIYGVDLLGNIWRFDVNDVIGNAGREAQLVANLTTSGGVPQPITTKPELAEVSGAPWVYVATGRYLGVTDKSDYTAQTVWAIKDPMTTNATPTDPVVTDLRTTLGARTITNVGTGTTAYRTVSAATCTSGNGWFADLPDTGERVNIDPKLQLGTLVVPSNVPETNACNVGGYGWLNYFNYTTGCAVPVSLNASVGRRLVGASGTESLAVGTNIVRLPGGKTVVIATTSAAEQITFDVPFDTPPPTGKRVSWREIVQ